MPVLVDYHIHSIFSLDSDAPVEKVVKWAIREGIREICFTEHKDLDPKLGKVEYYDDIAYTEELQRVREKYAGNIEIRKGVEIDFQSWMIPQIEDFLSKHSFDFVMASVHAIDHEFVGPRLFEKSDVIKIYHDYMNETLALSSRTFFDVIGHLDYVKRFGNEYSLFCPVEFREILAEIMKNLIANEKGIELNTSGWRHSCCEPYPSEYILRMFREMGGKIITIGSDAHQPERVGGFVWQGIELLRKVGFGEIYGFRGRVPYRISINGDSL